MKNVVTVPYVLETVSVELHAQGIKLDTVSAHGVHVKMVVRYEPVSERYDEPHVVVESILPVSTVALFGDNKVLDLWTDTDLLPLLPRSTAEAIQEELLARQGA